MKYRTLTMHDKIQLGDLFQTWGDGETHLIEKYKEYIGRRGDYCGRWRRPVKEHNWISFKDRKPTKEDAASQNIICNNEKSVSAIGLVLARHEGGKIKLRSVDYLQSSGSVFTHWMPLNFVEDAPAPIKVDGHEVLPNKDGSLKVGCTIIPKTAFEEIIRQREEVMKDG